MGNSFAYLSLVFWLLLSIYWYRVKSVQIATLWTVIGGFLFLPVKTAVDLPMLPAMGKSSVPVVAMLIGCYLIKRKHISYFKGLGKIRYIVILFLTVPFITANLNAMPVITTGLYLPGLTLYDGLSYTINQFLVIAPFFIGRQFFKTYDEHLAMFKWLVIAGLLYSIFILIEVRLSPQLHTWVYGYFPHSFEQHHRFGGFRPVVFIGHGLLVSLFVAVVLICATALSKNKIRVSRFSSNAVNYYLMIILFLSKSIAPFMYGFFAFILIKKAKHTALYKVAVTLAMLAILYPAMSMMGIFPHKAVINVAESFDVNRAQSLEFRFKNEDLLLEHAKENLFFGWGGWGRNRVYSEDTGRDLTVTDGRWIITFGQFGIFGFIAEFGLLAMTVFRAYKASKKVKFEREQSLLSAHALLISLIMVDQIPNASLDPWLWLIAGVLYGRADAILAVDKKQY